MKVKQALLTGYRGFIGSNILQELQTRKIDVCLIDKEETDNNLRECIDSSDIVIHQGAITDTLNFNVYDMMNVNFAFSKRIFDAAVDQGKKIIFASSASIYKKHNDPPDPVNLYAWSKYCAEQYGLALVKFSDVPFIALRYFNVYGPGEEHKGKMASVALQAFKQKHMDLFPCGPSRDFVFVKDVVSAVIHAMENDIPTGAYDVGTGDPRPFEEVCAYMKVPFDYLNGSAIPEGYQFYTCADKKKWMPGWTPKYKLEDGVTEYRKYLCKQKM